MCRAQVGVWQGPGARSGPEPAWDAWGRSEGCSEKFGVLLLWGWAAGAGFLGLLEPGRLGISVTHPLGAFAPDGCHPRGVWTCTQHCATDQVSPACAHSRHFILWAPPSSGCGQGTDCLVPSPRAGERFAFPGWEGAPRPRTNKTA